MRFYSSTSVTAVAVYYVLAEDLGSVVTRRRNKESSLALAQPASGESPSTATWMAAFLHDQPENQCLVYR